MISVHLLCGFNAVVCVCKRWNDFQLAWKSGDFGNVTKTRVPISKLWYPDIAVINRCPRVVLSVVCWAKYTCPAQPFGVILTLSCTLEISRVRNRPHCFELHAVKNLSSKLIFTGIFRRLPTVRYEMLRRSCSFCNLISAQH